MCSSDLSPLRELQILKDKLLKKITATLKNNKGKVLKKTRITLKIKGKIYKAKTNKKAVVSYHLPTPVSDA